MIIEWVHGYHPAHKERGDKILSQTRFIPDFHRFVGTSHTCPVKHNIVKGQKVYIVCTIMYHQRRWRHPLSLDARPLTIGYTVALACPECFPSNSRHIVVEVLVLDVHLYKVDRLTPSHETLPSKGLSASRKFEIHCLQDKPHVFASLYW